MQQLLDRVLKKKYQFFDVLGYSAFQRLNLRPSLVNNDRGDIDYEIQTPT